MGYNMFSQLQGPVVSTSLFGDAQSQGINAGNAQKTPIQAGVEGLISGVQTGQKFLSDQEILTKQQGDNAVNSTPEGIQRRIDAQQAETQLKIAQAEAEAAKAQDGIDSAAKLAKAQADAAKYTQQYQDQTILTSANQSIATNTPEQNDALLQNPAYIGAVRRLPPQEHDSTIAQFDNGHSSKYIFDQVYKTENAFAIEKENRAIAQQQTEYDNREADKNKAEYTASNSVVTKDSQLGPKLAAGLNPNRVKMYKGSDLLLENNQPVIGDNKLPNLSGPNANPADTRQFAIDTKTGQVLGTYDELTGKELDKHLAVVQKSYDAFNPLKAKASGSAIAASDTSNDSSNSDTSSTDRPGGGTSIAGQIPVAGLGAGAPVSTDEGHDLYSTKVQGNPAAIAEATFKMKQAAEIAKKNNQEGTLALKETEGGNRAIKAAAAAGTSAPNVANGSQAAPQSSDTPPLTQPSAEVAKAALAEASPEPNMSVQPPSDTSSTGYGNRADGTPKGTGFLGELKRPDGKVSTELSIGVNIDGKDVEIPSLVPGLTADEKNSLLNLKEGEKPSQAIIDKATAHAKERIDAGKSPFADNSESPNGSSGSWDTSGASSSFANKRTLRGDLGKLNSYASSMGDAIGSAIGSVAKGAAGAALDVGKGIYNTELNAGQAVGSYLELDKVASYLGVQNADAAELTSNFLTNRSAASHLSNVIVGNPKVTLNTDSIPIATKPVIDKINSIPALQNSSAIIKGLIAVESHGDAYAVSPAGAAGIAQFMPNTAREMGLSPTDVYDPNKAVPAAANYLVKKYDEINKSISKAFNAQGVALSPDPRMVLASYNGGAGDVLAAIHAGKTTWAKMKPYLAAVKTKPGAALENITYADKVLTAAVPFIKGGNASDDALVKSMISFGIMDVG